MITALTIAGSDSSGGAGIQGDLKTFGAHGLYGMSVITAITAQNTLGITHVHPCPAMTVELQLRALFDDIKINTIKIGMLCNLEIMNSIIEVFDMNQLPPIVLDPVLISSTGHPLLEDNAISSMLEKLIPMTTLITPNIPESEYLTAMKINTIDDMKKACEKLSRLGSRAILLKGGHLTSLGNETIDLLYTDGEFITYKHPKLITKHTHGTGCTLSSAIAAGLGKGLVLPEAVQSGIQYVQEAYAHAFPLGQGIGPANHFFTRKMN